MFRRHRLPRRLASSISNINPSFNVATMNSVIVLSLSYLVTCGGERREPASSPKQSSVVVIDDCAAIRSLTVRGKKTRVGTRVSLPESLALAARAAAAAGIDEVTVETACKLTTKALASYCDAFAKEHIDVVSVNVPSSGPASRTTLHCGDTPF